eukprot:1568448-Lingulodinium_polyedra.AAC.1
MEVGGRCKRQFEPHNANAFGLARIYGLGAVSVDTLSGTAKRSSQRILASEAACRKDWIVASLDIDKAFLK